MPGCLQARFWSGSVAPPTMLTYRYVGMTGYLPNVTYTTNSTKAAQLGRFPDYIMSDSDQIAVWWDNWAYTGTEVNGTSTFNIVKMSIEIPGAPTPVVAVNFSGVRTKTFTAGQALVYSDLINASSFGLTYFPAGTQIWYKWVAATTGTVTDVTRDRGVMNGPGGAAVISGSISGYYQSPGDSTDTNQVDTAGAWNIGAITTGAGAVGANIHFPSGIIGRTTSTAEPIVATVDSLGDGYQAFSFNGTADTGGMLRSAAWEGGKAIFTMGRFGTACNTMSTKCTAMIQAQYSSSRLFAVGVVENITNLFDGVNSLATIQGIVTSFWAVVADATHGGARPVYTYDSVIPNQTSTAGATTYPSQTKYAGGPAYFEAYNTWLASNAPSPGGALNWTGMYDPAQSNKITTIARSWTLGTTVSGGATTLRLNGSLTPIAGEGIWVGGSGAEAAMIGTVTVVTPGSVWDVSLYSTANTQLNLTGAMATGHTSGVTVTASYQPLDLAHFTQNGHSLMRATLVTAAPFI